VSQVRLRHRLEYLAFRAAVSQLLNLPNAAAMRVMEGVGRLAFHVLSGRTRTGRENIAAAFPRLDAAEVDALLKRVYENLFRLVGEVFYLRRLVTRRNWRDYIDIEGGENALDVFLEGRGGILVSGHIGNWELLSHVLPFLGLPARVLARPLDNPLLERYILGVREGGDERVVVKQGAGAVIESALEKGDFVSLLVDQDAGRKGAFVPFFGRSASTWRSPALLSMKTGAPIVAGCCVRTGDGRFRVKVAEPVYPRDTADVTAETLRITAAFTGIIEGWAREHPEQYLWLHRRWKSVPGKRSIVLKQDGSE
jgi:KDO2-lipid IV(A) lauroyltransferase